MRTLGIIVEYNPLHYGHEHHFLASKAAANADMVVAVMSGHFLQRGEPALVDKWARAEMALRLGVDLVIELPVAYAVQPAEWFAFGAVSALEATGVVDCLCFGSESGDIEWLKSIANELAHEPESFRMMLKNALKTGIPYPKAYSEAVKQYIQPRFSGSEEKEAQPSGNDLSLPNNNLGLHYLLALKRLNSRIVPLTIPRIKAGYHEREVSHGKIASATAIRRLIDEKKELKEIAPFVPPFTYQILEREWNQGKCPVRWESFAVPLLYRLVSAPAQELANIHEVREGLEYRIKRVLARLEHSSLPTVEDILTALKTKRYTRTKLQRTLLHILLHHPKSAFRREKLRQGVSYLRVLGFSEKGRSLLKQMKKTARVPVITNIPKQRPPFLELDLRATSVYALAYSKPKVSDMFRDFYEPPLRIS